MSTTTTTTKMAAAQHMKGVRELDLSACHQHSITDRINAVPGLRTSAGECRVSFLS